MLLIVVDLVDLVDSAGKVFRLCSICFHINKNKTINISNRFGASTIIDFDLFYKVLRVSASSHG